MITVERVGAVAMAGVAAIHLVLAPEYLSEEPYIGALFLLGAVAGAVIAWRLWRSADTTSWAAGAFIAAGMAAGFVLSRTVGLPGFHESEWEASGILSLLLEGTFLAAAVGALTSRSPATVWE
jgi:hypothetical protein